MNLIESTVTLDDHFDLALKSLPYQKWKSNTHVLRALIESPISPNSSCLRLNLNLNLNLNINPTTVQASLKELEELFKQEGN